MKKHPVSDRSLRRFVSGTSSRAESLSIVAHLLHGCTACAAAVNASLRPEIPEGAYDALFDRLADEISPVGSGTLPAFAQRLHVPAPVAGSRGAAHHGRR